jgi:hypothetical protein
LLFLPASYQHVLPSTTQWKLFVNTITWTLRPTSRWRLMSIIHPIYICTCRRLLRMSLFWQYNQKRPTMSMLAGMWYHQHWSVQVSLFFAYLNTSLVFICASFPHPFRPVLSVTATFL